MPTLLRLVSSHCILSHPAFTKIPREFHKADLSPPAKINALFLSEFPAGVGTGAYISHCVRRFPYGQIPATCPILSPKTQYRRNEFDHETLPALSRSSRSARSVGLGRIRADHDTRPIPDELPGSPLQA